jgi:phosphoglycolate phosphatase-like HAD superfamily hydrolase
MIRYASGSKSEGRTKGMPRYDPERLTAFKPQHDFFVGIDSDGCVFDSMEIKHKECFIPNIIKYWDLQAVSKYARETAEFVNLYSKWRGTNRFPALVMVFDFLKERPQVMKRGVDIPDVPTLRAFIESGVSLGNPALRKEVEKTGDPVLSRTLQWSEAVNAAVSDMVKGVPPFPFVRESLDLLSQAADIIVVSATPGEALQREWEENGIASYAAIIAGQEMGSKKEHLKLAAAEKYKKNHVLMIGDAPGDFKAARANSALFYPIHPGHEEESWERFFKEGCKKFLSEDYAGEYEKRRIDEFEQLLPNVPPW